MMKKIVGLLLSLVLLASGFSCGRATPETVDIFAPDGAPALALAYAIKENTREDVRYTVVEASTVPAFVSFEDKNKNADICVLPVNAAAKLLGSGEEYLLLGVATHGNLFLLGEGEKITSANAGLLAGKTVGVVQLANIPGLVTKAALSQLGLGVSLLLETGYAADKVNLKAVAPSKDLKTLGVDYLVVGSPIAEGLGLPFAGSLQELYGGENGYPQAVVVAKKELVEREKDWLDGFLEDLKYGGEWLKTAGAEEIFSAYSGALDKELKASFTVENLTAQTIENAGVYFTSATESKEDILRFLENIGAGENLPADGFFYEEK